MISNTVLRTVETNTAQTQGFSTKQSGKMFNLLVSGLYSDKAQSITREIWSNAYDAHRDAGKEHVPFKVQFPSTFNPMFLCRDYGKGLSHEFMLTRYTVLGDSTKEDTNNAVGKWGVGRMSPLAYTNSFNVASVHQGMKAHYVVQLGIDGGPELHVMSEPHATEDPSGLTVSFPVERKDVSVFASAADRVSFGFDIKPDTNDIHTWPELEGVIDGMGYQIYRNRQLLRGVYAKMGCVLYPIPRDILGKLEGSHIIMDFDIGDLEVTASREGLSFGKHDPTKDSIEKKVETIIKDIHADIQKKLDAAPTKLSAKKSLIPVRNSLEYRLFSSLNELGFTYNKDSLSADNSLSLNHLKESGIRLSSRNSVFQSSKKNYVCSSPNYILDASGGVLFLQDTSKKVVRLRNRMWDYIQVQPNEDKGWAWVEYDGACPHEVKAMKQVVAMAKGVYKPVKVEDLPDAGPVQRSSGTRTKVMVKQPTRLCDYKINTPIELDDVGFKAGGIYIPTTKGRHQTCNDANTLFTFLSACTDKPIYVVPKTLQKKFNEASQWVDIKDAAEAYAKKEFKRLYKYASYDPNLGYVQGSMAIREVLQDTGISDITVSPAFKALQEYTRVFNATIGHYNIDRGYARNFLTTTMGTDFDSKKEAYKKVREQVIADYPLFKFLDHRVGNTATLLEYMEDRQHHFTTTNPAQKG